MAWSICQPIDTLCFWFDKTSDPASWPNKIHADAGSVTGYAYGNLTITDNNKEGFELPDKVWIIKEKETGNAYWVTDEIFKKRFKSI